MGQSIILEEGEEALAKLLQKIVQEVRSARKENFSGKLTAEAEMHRGGITAKHFAKHWSER